MLKHNRVSLIFLVLMIILQGCYINLRETVYGSGNVVSEKRSVSSFDEIKVSSGIDVFITQGNKEALEVVADDNLLEFIKTEVSSGCLRIYTDVNIRHSKSREVHLVYRQLRSINISSAGDVKGTNKMKANDLDIHLSSAGDLELTVSADQINCDISSSGDAHISGTADELDADLSSAGDLYAYDLIVKKARVQVSSAGNARIHATEEVYLKASSAGDIYYMGNPHTIHTNTSSAGSIIKR
jgi:hypothetical protein